MDTYTPNMTRTLHWPLRGAALLLATAAMLVPPVSSAQSSPGGVTASWPSATMVRGSTHSVTGTVADVGGRARPEGAGRLAHGGDHVVHGDR